MWIKAVYCTKDVIYAERLIAFFDKEYGNKIELNTCDSIESLFDFLKNYQTDMVLFGEEFEKEAMSRSRDIPCTCAFMTEQFYESQSKELHRIDKYQRGDSIYKDILDAYAAGGKVKHIRTTGAESGGQKVYVFTSACGGSGTTTIARAYARKCASYEKVLYLDFDLFSDTEVTEGNEHGMDEIILALKSRRNILPLKLMSAVASMADRVYTYAPCSDMVSMLELNAQDAHNLVNGITALSEYQKIIIDIGSSVSDSEIAFMKCADFIICIVDESEIGARKYEKFCEFLENAGKKEQMRILRKLLVFRNKVKQDYNNNSRQFKNEVTGWAPYVSVDSYDAVIDRIARSDSFSNLEIRNAE